MRSYQVIDFSRISELGKWQIVGNVANLNWRHKWFIIVIHQPSKMRSNVGFCVTKRFKLFKKVSEWWPQCSWFSTENYINAIEKIWGKRPKGKVEVKTDRVDLELFSRYLCTDVQLNHSATDNFEIHHSPPWNSVRYDK